MPNPNLLREGIKKGDLAQVRRSVEQENTDVNSDLTRGHLGVLSNYTPTLLKGVVWSENRDNIVSIFTLGSSFRTH